MNTEKTHYSNEDLAELDAIVILGDRLQAGDTVDYVDDGTGSGGYMDGCGDDRNWGDLKARLAKRDLVLDDNGSEYVVTTSKEPKS